MNSNLQDTNMKGKAIRSVARAAVAFLAMGIVAAPSMFAKPKEKKADSGNLGVIAHVKLDSGTATRMMLVEKNGKEYLYVGFGSSSGFCIFDVTKPAVPRKLEKFSGANDEQIADFQHVGDTMTLTSKGTDEPILSSDGAQRSVTILDTTNPANPRQIQTFSGVTSVVSDVARGQIYLSNGEGLWIVQAKQPQKDDPSLYGA
jgi:hypothetical protein